MYFLKANLRRLSLNPFLIRSLVQTKEEREITLADSSLNPFLIRSLVQTKAEVEKREYLKAS